MKHTQQSKIKIVVLLVCLVFLATLVAVYYNLWKPHTKVINYTALPTPTPSPGKPGNPGNSAKSNQASSSPTLAPTPSPASITITSFTINPRSGGQVHVTSYLSGTTSGTCSLTLISPSNQVHKFVGTIEFSASYYFCSFGTIDSITEGGNWTAALTAAGSGKISSQATTEFKIGA